MSNNLVLRTVISPYGDETKGSVLSHIELDNNFIFLKGKTLSNGEKIGDNLVLTTLDGTQFTINIGSITGGSNFDVYVTGGSYNNVTGIATFTNNTGGTFTVNGFSTSSSTFTGGTITGPTIFTNGLTANTISATTYLNLPTDIRITGGTYSNGTATFTNNTGGTFSVSGFSTGSSFNGGTVSGLTATTISATTYLGLPTDIRVTGGSYTNGTATFTNNTGGTFNVTGFKNNDVFVTGGSYTNGTATFTNNTGGTFTVTGFKNNDVFVTGGSYSNLTSIITFTNNTGGTFTVSGISSGSGSTFTGGTITGPTFFTSGLTANTISATTYLNLPTDIRVTGGTYSNGTATFTNNTGGTFNVTGFSTGGSFSGGTVSGLTATTISATTYLNLPTDIRVTGGTYTAGTITFRNNTGGTFTITGFTTANTYTTGATLIGSTVFFNRTDALSAYSVNLSSLTTGSSVSGNYVPLSGGSMTGKLFTPSISATTLENGINVIASGISSHAEGYNTISYGDYSHSEGAAYEIYLSGVSRIRMYFLSGNTIDSIDDTIISTTGNTSFSVSGDYSYITSGSVRSILVNESNLNDGFYLPISNISGNTFTTNYNGILDTTQFIFNSQLPNPIYRQNNLAYGIGSHVENGGNVSVGNYSHLEGLLNINSGIGSHSEGYMTVAANAILNLNFVTAYTENSFLVANVLSGYTLSGRTLFGLGESNIVGDIISCVFTSTGTTINTSGLNLITHDEFVDFIAPFNFSSYSHSEGSGTTALGAASHTEGLTTLAYGNYSHAEGIETQASGYGSHAEGYSTKTFGTYSHSMGSTTVAYGDYSFVGGNDSKSGILSYLSSSIIDGVITFDGAYGDISSNIYTLTILSKDYICLSDEPYDSNYINSLFEYTAITYNAPNTVIYLKDTTVNTTSAYIANINTFENNINHIFPTNGQFSIGNNSKALGNYSYVNGNVSVAIGDYSISEGQNSVAIGTNSKSSGEATLTFGNYSNAIGNASIAYGEYSMSQGTSITYGYGSHAQGENSVSFGLYSHAEGQTGLAGLAGYSSETIVNGVITLPTKYGDVTNIINGIGNYNSITSNSVFLYTDTTDTLVLKRFTGTTYTGDKTVVYLEDTAYNPITHKNIIPAEFPIDNGSGIPDNADMYIGDVTHAEGRATRAVGKASHTEGFYTQSAGYASHAEGKGATSNGYASHAEGDSTFSNGDYSHTEGVNTMTTNPYSHAEGQYTNTGNLGYYFTSATNSLIVLDGKYKNVLSEFTGGTTNTVLQNTLIFTDSGFDNIYGKQLYEFSAITYNGNSVEIQFSNVDVTTTEGYVYPIFTNYSLPKNADILPSGFQSSHSEGFETNAFGSYSHAEGYNTLSYGNYSSAKGEGSIASGDSSNASGLYTISYQPYQTVMGKYNLYQFTGETPNALLVIGCGTSNKRVDALRVEIISGVTATIVFGQLGTLDYADDTEAGNNMIPIGGLYNTGGIVKVRKG